MRDFLTKIGTILSRGDKFTLFYLFPFTIVIAVIKTV